MLPGLRGQSPRQDRQKEAAGHRKMATACRSCCCSCKAKGWGEKQGPRWRKVGLGHTRRLLGFQALLWDL